MTVPRHTPMHERDLLRTIFQTRTLLRAGISPPEASRAYEASRRRFIFLQLAQHDFEDPVERALWEALYEYELHRSELARTRYLCRVARDRIGKVGMIGAAIEIVLQGRLPHGQRALVGHDHPDFNFETVIVNHRDFFGRYLVDFARTSLRLRQAAADMAASAAS